MVMNIPMHAEEACVLRFFVSNEDCFPGVKKRSKKNDSYAASHIERDTCERRACNLLPFTLISIAASEKSGVALGY
ncbi:hypothetical protein EV677_2720 [Herminiimonas fonticola]|uniref:Uncharacterized protein n=1 Tax=Herminiimonas fonticola TaxID=303380 RepID=A0A4R6G1K7_9BURK|nr:hypothetical protein Hfont_2323 [Herminiimonas fonticola]TDN88233.1 hypothetical protein EV677_2720 [Herminiimonas fonticola]